MEKDRLTDMQPDSRRRTGIAGEGLAARYLRQAGYEILRTNYRFARAEVDIIARHNGAIVFVEVKTRRSNTFGEPHEAITKRKRWQLRKAAEGYLLENGITDAECRFDVLAISFRQGRAFIDHIEQAF